MTMYPGGAAPMYMVTWPDVGTLNTGISLSDHITFPHRQSVLLSGKVSWQQQSIHSDDGFNALHLFFPAMVRHNTQITGRVAANYAWHPKNWNLSVGAGWGSRAPSVTEAYGYYLNNTFDQYDYIGNPYLKNESAIEVNSSLGWNPSGLASSLSFVFDANAFFFSDYIIGAFEERLSPMTVAAEGVKVYQNQDDVRIVNVSLSAQWQPLRSVSWHSRISYALGRDGSGQNLPLISPFAYQTKVILSGSHTQCHVEVVGNARQTSYGQKYGEKATPAYMILNLNAQYHDSLAHLSYIVRVGIENLFDRYYSVYSDWNQIPQKGRNIYLNLSFIL